MSGAAVGSQAPATPRRYGRLVPPYPVEHCANDSCWEPLVEANGAYLYRDLESGKLVVFCETCGAYVELNHRQRFLLVAL